MEQDSFLEVAEKVVVYQLRSKWLAISKMYNEMAAAQDGTMSMAFILLTINDKEGTPVTKIAPRMGMEPNSLSRILLSMEKKGLIYRKKVKQDKRKVYMCLTDYGLSMRKNSLKAVFTLESALHETIAPEKMEAFFEVMEKIPSAMDLFKERFEDLGEI